MNVTEETFDKIEEKLKKKLRPLDVEHIMFVDIDEHGNPAHYITMAKGDVDSCTLQLSKVTDHIAHYWPKGIIIAHNHPGSLPLPSTADHELTKSVGKICRKNKVKIMDHIIVLKKYDFCFNYRKKEYYSNLVGIWQSKRKKK